MYIHITCAYFLQDLLKAICYHEQVNTAIIKQCTIKKRITAHAAAATKSQSTSTGYITVNHSSGTSYDCESQCGPVRVLALTASHSAVLAMTGSHS